MTPAGFPEQNTVMDTPDSMSVAECEPLQTWRGLLANGQPVVISCWRPTVEELAEIGRTGRVWVLVWGDGMPPIAVTGTSPFEGAKT